MHYFKDNEELLNQYGRIKGFEKSEEFLLDHSHLCSDYAASYLTIEALNLAMEEKVSLLVLIFWVLSGHFLVLHSSRKYFENLACKGIV